MNRLYKHISHLCLLLSFWLSAFPPHTSLATHIPASAQAEFGCSYPRLNFFIDNDYHQTSCGQFAYCDENSTM